MRSSRAQAQLGAYISAHLKWLHRKNASTPLPTLKPLHSPLLHSNPRRRGKRDLTHCSSCINRYQLLSHLNHPTPSQPTASQALSLLSSAVSMTASSATSLLSPLTSPSYRNLLTHCILSSLTSHNRYANIEDFEWYFAVLIGLAYVSPVPGPALRDTMHIGGCCGTCQSRSGLRGETLWEAARQ